MSGLPGNAEGRMSYAGFSRRAPALAWDLPVIVAWAVFAGIAGIGFNAIAGSRATSPWSLDLQAFLTLILPVILTFAYQEGSSRQATFGKRRFRMIVTDATGQPPGYRRALVRSVVKFVPWQLGHTAVFHLVAGSTSAVFVVMSIGAQLFVLMSLLVMVADSRHRALHDWAAGTRVMDATA